MEKLLCREEELQGQKWNPWYAGRQLGVNAGEPGSSRKGHPHHLGIREGTSSAVGAAPAESLGVAAREKSDTYAATPISSPFTSCLSCHWTGKVGTAYRMVGPIMVPSPWDFLAI